MMKTKYERWKDKVRYRIFQVEIRTETWINNNMASILLAVIILTSLAVALGIKNH